MTRVTHDDAGVRVTLDDGTVIDAASGGVALPLNVWDDIEFDPPLAETKRRAADQRHPGRVSKVLAVVHDAPATYFGMGWNTPINAGFVLRPAGDGRLFMGFSVQDRVDLADHDAVAAAVNVHLPEAVVDDHGRPRLDRRPLLAGVLAVGATHLVQRRHVRRTRPGRGPSRVRGFRHRAGGRRLDRRRGGQWRRMPRPTCSRCSPAPESEWRLSLRPASPAINGSARGA